MLDKALKGRPRYWIWLAFLSLFIAIGAGLWVFVQLQHGLGSTTGLQRDVPWGFYIAQLTFLVGVAASAVMVVLPYYLHNYKVFGRLAVLGEFLAISALTMCLLFVLVDLGQPMRGLNIFLHPHPRSMLFWDSVVIFGYFFINAIVAWMTFKSERAGVPPPGWVKPIIILSIPWAVSIHTVTAWLYCGLGGRPFWLTAILAPRFLASAFASGPSLLILLCLLVRKFTTFDPGKEAIKKLSIIVTYAMILNIFFVIMEVFTAAYSNIPEHLEHFKYLFFGLEGVDNLVPWMWTSEVLAAVAIVLLLVPRFRNDERFLVVAAVAVIASIWIDKGMGMVVTGFVPSPLGTVPEYTPAFYEVMITIGVYAIGAFMLTVFYKIATEVRAERRLYQQTEPSEM